MFSRKKVILLGATGSIGLQTIDVLLEHQDLFELVGFSYHTNTKKALEIFSKINVENICLSNESDQNHFQDVNIFTSLEDFVKIDADIVLNALVGSVGLKPTIAAIKSKKDIALANKEVLVMAGQYIKQLAKIHNVAILPVDSEHSAIFQCLKGYELSDVKKVILTASGGSFRDKTREQLVDVTKSDALNHPNWSMGSKITIDSATMMNKGFEVIEAYYLFDLEVDKIDVIMHKESIVHSFVEFKDGSLLCEIGHPDMRIPILYALSYPHRQKLSHEEFSLGKIKNLSFTDVSYERFPLLKAAYDCLLKGGLSCVILNAANEEAVNLFLNDKISFLEIETIVLDALAYYKNIENPTIDEIFAMDSLVRSDIKKVVR